MKTNSVRLFSLTDLSVVRIAGDDAVSFLQGQLTNDVASLGHRARLAGYCTPKGRLLASLVVWQAQSGDSPVLHALVRSDVAAALVKRLSMFVLRAKAKLEMLPFSVSGLAFPSIDLDGDKSLRAGTSAQSLPDAAPAWTVVTQDGGDYIAAPRSADDAMRWWFVPHSAETAAGIEAAGADLASWHAADIAAGLPWVEAATQDMFIPQTLNLDLIDGVSFTKGCYPGQEVVARSHYRGTIKRRMARGVATAELGASAPAGSDIYDANRPDTPCGRVINSAALADSIPLLLEVQLSDLDSADFRLGSPDGPSIRILPLPYDLQGKRSDQSTSAS